MIINFIIMYSLFSVSPNRIITDPNLFALYIIIIEKHQLVFVYTVVTSCSCYRCNHSYPPLSPSINLIVRARAVRQVK